MLSGSADFEINIDEPLGRHTVSHLNLWVNKHSHSSRALIDTIDA